MYAWKGGESSWLRLERSFQGLSTSLNATALGTVQVARDEEHTPTDNGQVSLPGQSSNREPGLGDSTQAPQSVSAAGFNKMLQGEREGGSWNKTGKLAAEGFACPARTHGPGSKKSNVIRPIPVRACLRAGEESCLRKPPGGEGLDLNQREAAMGEGEPLQLQRLTLRTDAEPKASREAAFQPPTPLQRPCSPVRPRARLEELQLFKEGPYRSPPATTKRQLPQLEPPEPSPLSLGAFPPVQLTRSRACTASTTVDSGWSPEQPSRGVAAANERNITTTTTTTDTSFSSPEASPETAAAIGGDVARTILALVYQHQRQGQEQRQQQAQHAALWQLAVAAAAQTRLRMAAQLLGQALSAPRPTQPLSLQVPRSSLSPGGRPESASSNGDGPSSDGKKRQRGEDAVSTPGKEEGSKRQRRQRDRGHAPKICVTCSTLETPFWRKDHDSGGPLCNACGLYLKKNGSHRPPELWRAGPSGTLLVPEEEPAELP